MVPLRDGTRLATDIYMPAASGRHPVVILRNPYGRLLGGGCNIGLFAPGLVFLAQNGYVAIAQEVRGTNRSEGVFHAMTQEGQDGYDAIEWAAAQSWSTGKVGTTSGSYLGLTQWQPAIHTPPHLAAIAPGVTGSDYHDNWSYVDAALDLWLDQSWPAGAFVPDQIIRKRHAQGIPQAQIDQEVAAWNASVNNNLFTNWVWQLPLTSFSQFREFAPYYYDWLAHPSYDA
jgi:putative CocE/NonD family hydrolase